MVELYLYQNILIKSLENKYNFFLNGIKSYLSRNIDHIARLRLLC